jgi:hypothetical protein
MLKLAYENIKDGASPFQPLINEGKKYPRAIT